MIFSTALPTIVGQLHGVDHMSWVTDRVPARLHHHHAGLRQARRPDRPQVAVRRGDRDLPRRLRRSADWPARHDLAHRRARRPGPRRRRLSWCCRRRSSPTSCPPASGAATWASWAASSPSPRWRGRCSAAGSPSTIGWRWAFWMNVPLALLAITAAIALLHACTGYGTPAAGRRSALRPSRCACWPTGTSCSPPSVPVRRGGHVRHGRVPADVPADGGPAHPDRSRACTWCRWSSASGPPRSLPAHR